MYVNNFALENILKENFAKNVILWDSKLKML